MTTKALPHKDSSLLRFWQLLRGRGVVMKCRVTLAYPGTRARNSGLPDGCLSGVLHAARWALDGGWRSWLVLGLLSVCWALSRSPCSLGCVPDVVDQCPADSILPR